MSIMEKTIKERTRNWILANEDKVKKHQQTFYSNPKNRFAKSLYMKEYRDDPDNKLVARAYQQIYYYENRERIRKQQNANRRWKRKATIGELGFVFGTHGN